MKCNQGRDCYFFQDCQFYPKMNLCHGYCEWSGWSIEVVIWTIVVILAILAACYIKSRGDSTPGTNIITR